MNPYLLALFASLCFGMVVFPWQSTIRSVGTGGFFAVTGLMYLVAGVVLMHRQSSPVSWSLPTLAIAVLTGGIYVLALLLCSWAFARPNINLGVAAAITAAYPAWTALILTVTGKRLTLLETLSLVLVVVGLIGLGLTTRPVD